LLFFVFGRWLAARTRLRTRIALGDAAVVVFVWLLMTIGVLTIGRVT
jgi:hypothetical protein